MRIRNFRGIQLTAALTIFTLIVAYYTSRTIQYVVEEKNRLHHPTPFYGPLTPERTAEYCNAHGFSPFILQDGQRERRVYDLFLLSHELDWLEVRLHTLSPYVDYFVIVESNTTFTGLPKPAHLQDHWEDFAPFHHKIIHRVIADPGPSIGTRSWDHEDFFRNSLLYSVFPSLVGTPQEAQAGDVLVLSDVDEIPKPHILPVLRKCSIPDRLTLRSDFYYYSFQWRHVGEAWAHPQVTTYRGLKQTISPKNLRNGEPASSGWFGWNQVQVWWQSRDFWAASWHCSSCFRTVAEVQKKMNSFSHTKWNTEENRDVNTIVQRVREGKDLFGRDGEKYERVEANSDVPGYILQNPRRFGYMLNRDGPNAGFEDVDPESLTQLE